MCNDNEYNYIAICFDSMQLIEEAGCIAVGLLCVHIAYRMNATAKHDIQALI